MLGGNVFSPSSKNPLAKDAIPRNTDRLVLNQGQSPTCGHNSCAMVLDTLGKPVNVESLPYYFSMCLDPSSLWLTALFHSQYWVFLIYFLAPNLLHLPILKIL